MLGVRQAKEPEMTTTTPTRYTGIAADKTTAELHQVITGNDALLNDHANGVEVLTDDEYETAAAILAAARIELGNRELMHTQAIIEYAATKGHPRAVNHVAFQQAVGHLADLVRKYKLDGEDIHTLVCAIDGDGATTPETYWGPDLTDTFAYLVNYCTVLDESAETLFQEVSLVLGW
jgi:hypothetical protein